MFKHIFSAFLIIFLAAPALAQGAEKKAATQGGGGIKCWTFDQSADRKNALWRKGVTAKEVASRAARAGGGKNSRKSGEEKKADEKAFNGGLSVESQKRTWQAAPRDGALRPDEKRFREGRHVFRAFADVAPSKDLDINIGPELIIKDDQAETPLANATQPDTVLGMGMNFKLDF